MADDFDIDLDALAGEAEEPAAPAEPVEAAPAAETADARQRAMSARKPGKLHRLGDKVAAPFTRVRLPEWNLRTFLYLLVVILILWFLLENWPPVRVRLLIWNGEAPKTILFLFNLLLGAALLRWWQLFTAQRAAHKAAAEETAAAEAPAAPQ
ncbi:MAG TPA: hypothetical protein VGM19_00570 [Armatimonadota bacterium]